MKYVFYIVLLLAFALLIFYAGVSDKQAPQPDNNPQAEQQNAPQGQWETQTNSEGSVTVTVTPIWLGKTATTWKFNITLDAHVGSLDTDLLTTSRIVDDAGISYTPIVWQGPGPGGHHREGILMFIALNPTPAQATLRIKPASDMAVRTFVWDME